MKYWAILILNLLNLSIEAQVVKLDSSNLPICIIDTRGKVISNEPKILAHMKIIYNGPGKMNKANDQKFNYNNFIAIETRGNSSQFYPQLQYGLELRDSVSGNDLNVPLINMPAEEDWILYAPYNDISMLRNVLTYYLWNEMGHWGPRTRFCELILNNEYVGIYILMESIKRDSNRVNIAKLSSNDTVGRDLTGGYIMKIDKINNTSDLSFISKVKSTNNQNINWIFHYPDSNDIRPSQQKYIQNFIDTVETLIASPSFSDPKKGYYKYLSVNSFVDYFLINEFSRNIDAYKASSFFYKEKLEADGSKGMLKAGPVWDYNFAYGNANFCSGAQTNGWMYDGCVPATLPTPVLWRRLLQDTNYANAVKCRYIELRKTIWDTSFLFRYLNKYAFDTLDIAQKRHFSKWKILGTNPGGFNAYIASSYTDEMNRLKNWLRNRLNWMDANLTGRCIPIPVIAKIEIPLDPECFNGTRPMMQKIHPFKVPPFNYQGVEKINTIPSNIIRWVLVELRNSSDSTIIIDRRAALLRSDSVLVDTNFIEGIFFPKAIEKQNYFLVVRYDGLSYLMSNEKVQLPNDNDYNLNRSHRLISLSVKSPVIYNSNWLTFDTLFSCEGQSITLSDSNLIKSGYSFEQHLLSTSGPGIKIINPHEISLNINNPGYFPIELYLNCKDHTIIRCPLVVNIGLHPTVEIAGDSSICINDSIQIGTKIFTRYLWNTGDTIQQIWVSKAGKYEVQVIDINGCTSKITKDIYQYPEIKGKIKSEPNFNLSTCKLYFDPDNPNQQYSFLWSNGANTDTIITAEKVVSLQVTDIYKCKKEFTIICNPLNNSELTKPKIQIFPNPNSGSFVISSSITLNSLWIYTSNSRLIYQEDKKESKLPFCLFRFENLLPGIYFGRALGDQEQIIFKFVVR